MARTSAADLAHSLKGAHFPISKEDLMKLAGKNGVPEDVCETMEELPDEELPLRKSRRPLASSIEKKAVPRGQVRDGQRARLKRAVIIATAGAKRGRIREQT